MPPLVVQGILLTADGEPWAEHRLIIALSDFYAQPETFRALTSGDIEGEAYGYRFCDAHTTSRGEFSCRLAGESRYIGFIPPLMWPGEDTLKSFVVGIRTAARVVMAVSVSGRKTEVRVPEGPEFTLAKPGSLPFIVTASASRSAQTDVLQLVLRARQSAVQQAVAADAQQHVPIDPWYRSGGGRCASSLAVSAAARS